MQRLNLCAFCAGEHVLASARSRGAWASLGRRRRGSGTGRPREVDAWARYEGGKAGDKVGWTEKDVGGAVAVRVLELVNHLTGAIG